ncbi:hypothetical protein FRB99_007103 [Tulasnella sp. 403]|nr:hypothetical protein FRB99_007103 [Tulasnella sp. 403]
MDRYDTSPNDIDIDHSPPSTTTNLQPTKKPGRGRRRDDSLPYNRARDVQRAFRARRAAHLENLEHRVQELEEENAQLREALCLDPSERAPLGKGPTGRGKIITGRSGSARPAQAPRYDDEQSPIIASNMSATTGDSPAPPSPVASVVGHGSWNLSDPSRPKFSPTTHPDGAAFDMDYTTATADNSSYSPSSRDAYFASKSHGSPVLITLPNPRNASHSPPQFDSSRPTTSCGPSPTVPIQDVRPQIPVLQPTIDEMGVMGGNRSAAGSSDTCLFAFPAHQASIHPRTNIPQSYDRNDYLPTQVKHESEDAYVPSGMPGFGGDYYPSHTHRKSSTDPNWGVRNVSNGNSPTHTHPSSLYTPSALQTQTDTHLWGSSHPFHHRVHQTSQYPAQLHPTADPFAVDQVMMEPAETLTKHQTYDFENSNIALLGSDIQLNFKIARLTTPKLEKRVREEAGEHEPAWDAISPGEDRYGEFFSGDSYIVLHTYKKRPDADAVSYDLHFWLGEETTADEAVSGSHEPRVSSVPVVLQTLHRPRGGVATGFHHVGPPPINNTHRLYRIHADTDEKPLAGSSPKRMSAVVVREVNPSAPHVVEGEDVYVLDKGTEIWQLNTPGSVGREKFKARVWK